MVDRAAKGDEASEPAVPDDGPTGTPESSRGSAGQCANATARTVRPVIRWLLWARRASQAAFLIAFFLLLFATTFRGAVSSAEQRVRLGWPVEAFLFADPFAALVTLLSTHTVYRGLLWSLGIVVLTVVCGRAFCGWICPFGTLHHIAGWLFPSRYLRGSRRVAQNRTHPVRQRVKYYLLYASLGAAAVGSALGGVLDPICMAIRGIGLAVLPATQYAVRAGTEGAAATNVRALQTVSDGAADLLAATVWQSRQSYVHEGWLLGVLIVALLVLNRFVPRFWCRVLCPLGALLGLLSRWSLLGMKKDHAKCTDCNLCLVHCQGGDSPQGGVPWRQDECHLCLNCEAVCPEGVITFSWLPERAKGSGKPDRVRRTAIASAAAGAAIVPLTRTTGVLDATSPARLVRPPGSTPEREFLERCIRCGECMKVCPNGALHPTLFEAGLEGLWTPMLIPRIGYCEQTCVLCGDVCPTGAIQKITEEHRLGDGGPPIAIGTAFFDRGRCLPWAMGTPCVVCEEFCPTSPKAIWVEEAEVPTRISHAEDPDQAPEQRMAEVGRPHLDPTQCIGCGACEHVCPVQDQPAVYVTSVGESRSKTNVILLEDRRYEAERASESSAARRVATTNHGPASSGRPS